MDENYHIIYVKSSDESAIKDLTGNGFVRLMTIDNGQAVYGIDKAKMTEDAFNQFADDLFASTLIRKGLYDQLIKIHKKMGAIGKPITNRLTHTVYHIVDKGNNYCELRKYISAWVNSRLIIDDEISTDKKPKAPASTDSITRASGVGGEFASEGTHISFAHETETCVCYILSTGWLDFFMVIHEYPFEERIERYTRLEILHKFKVPKELFDKVFYRHVEMQQIKGIGEWRKPKGEVH